MGTEGLLALVGYVLMTVSIFLPWVTYTSYVYGITIEKSTSGLEFQGGTAGIFLLVIVVIGVLGTLFRKKKTLGVGLGDCLTGTFILLLVGYTMNIIEEVSASTNTSPPYVYIDLGVGGYLAAFSSLLVIVAGVATIVKVRSGGQTVKATSASAKASTGLRGSFSLNEQTINEKVDSGSPGVYALGYRKGKSFIIRQIGRSDTDVNAKLKECIGKYDRFKFDTSEFPSNAFTKECQLYHAFGGPEGKLDTKSHPDPEGMPWTCPMCSTFDSQVSSAKPQSVATTTGKRFCAECGVELPAEVRFCTHCGKAAA